MAKVYLATETAFEETKEDTAYALLDAADAGAATKQAEGSQESVSRL